MDLTAIKGIGPKRLKTLQELGIGDAEALLRFAPRTYQNFFDITTAKEARHGEFMAFCLQVSAPSKLAFPRKNMSIVSCSAKDCNGDSVTLIWFNQIYMSNRYSVGDIIYVYGRVDRSHGLKIMSPNVYLSNPGIIPVYPVKHKLPQSYMREWVKNALEYSHEIIKEAIPESLLENYSLPPVHYAIKQLHFPESFDELKNAQRRFAIEELLHYSIALNLIRAKRKKLSGGEMKVGDILSGFTDKVPFKLTDGQQRVMTEIARDLEAPIPMNRLLQGDVGSGKTLVAFFAIMVAVENGFQAAFLAPTEILAQQHMANAVKYFESDKVCLLTGSVSANEKRRIYERVKNGEIRLIIGTHAMMQTELEFDKLALVVCDEQQRFGVSQRAAMEQKGGGINLLAMSATPIPRTLALTLFGDLDVSTLYDMPVGRKPVKTNVVPQFKRNAMYDYIDKEAANGRQAYVVCPLIDSDEGLPMESAVSIYDELRKRLKCRVGLLHGRMKSSQKDEVMSEFRDGRISVLVSTTVIEVGVDVSSATTIIIESAERFGLSQLHQLRGRVGRGNMPGQCFLLASNDMPCERLNILKETFDGFKIAEEDLRMRGPGHMLGIAQHGDSELLSMLSNLDEDMLSTVRSIADSIFDKNPMKADFSCLINDALMRYKRYMTGVTLN